MRYLILALLWNFFIVGLDEKPLVIGICSYNNSRWYKKNLDSVFNQEYENYRIVYVDDFSEDDNGHLVESYVREQHQEHRFTLVKNEERRRAMANHYTIIHQCEDEEIIVSLDGDDYFANSQVLKKLNEVYHKGAWLAYSQFRRYPNNRLGYSKKMPPKVIENRDYRNCPWIWGQTRSYYAWLAKSIQLKDLLLSEDNAFKGKFLPSSCDVALMFPMLEMADGRCTFIPDVLYIYNMHDFTDYRTNGNLQGFCNWYVRQLPRYKPLSMPASNACYHKVVDMVIGDENKFDEIFMWAKENIEIELNIYRVSEYTSFNKESGVVRPVLLVQSPIETNFDIKECLDCLEQTGATAFFIEPILPAQHFSSFDYFFYNGKRINFWQFGEDDYTSFLKGRTVLLPGKSAENLFSCRIDSPNQLPKMLMKSLCFDPRDIALFVAN